MVLVTPRRSHDQWLLVCHSHTVPRCISGEKKTPSFYDEPQKRKREGTKAACVVSQRWEEPSQCSAWEEPRATTSGNSSFQLETHKLEATTLTPDFFCGLSA